MASSTATGDYDVEYVYNMLETNMWLASSSANQDWTFDAGVGNELSADYFVLIGHNWDTASSVVSLEYSDTGAFSGEQSNVFFGISITSDEVFLIEFATQSARYWKLSINGNSVAPFAAICIWGDKTELDYATASYDPYGQTSKANVNVTQGGYMSGSHTKYLERNITFNFADADSTLYGKVKTWWDASGLKNLFVAWETANNPTDVWLMRPDTRFNNPLTNQGSYRNITISLKGRLE